MRKHKINFLNYFNAIDVILKVEQVTPTVVGPLTSSMPLPEP